MQERVYKTPLCDTGDLKQRLVDTMDKHITKRCRRSCCSMQKVVMCMSELKTKKLEARIL